MNSASAATATLPSQYAASRPHLDHKPSPVTAVIFLGLLAAGLLFTAYSLVTDVTEAGARTGRVPEVPAWTSMSRNRA